MALAILSLGLIGWVIYSSTVYFAHKSILAAHKQTISDRDTALERSDAAYRDLQARSEELKRKFLSVTRRLKEKQQHLVDSVSQNAALERSLGEIKGKLARSEKAYSHMASARDALARWLKQVENELEEITRRNAALNKEMAFIQGKLDDAQAHNAKAIADREALRKHLSSATEERNQLKDQKALLSQRLNELKDAMDRAVAERDEIMAQRLSLERRVKDLEHWIANRTEIQQKLIARLTEQAVSKNKEVEKTLALTELNVDFLLAELRRAQDETGHPAGQGGPYVAFLPEFKGYLSEFSPMSEIDAMLETLDGHLERWEGLNQIFRQVPLSAPVDQYRIVSKFGKRLDPITGSRAMHYGVDLSSYAKAPVLATAPGTVAFAGWKQKYGKIVEIDHGMGILTRYGHLRKIFVKKGQQVPFRQKIGLMGSTGRSTGPHVHYEVLVRGKHHNPLKFMKAGKYVFKK
ncbi:MAG: peptidoglycan DD-metalloendopeptidase family protein [Deltaproteobacteria bacterium]|nr:peptidoglycan DD-metalloendopeptidase family protein [Deltaproteobacteria bacterium]